jgi:hypothetical protein
MFKDALCARAGSAEIRYNDSKTLLNRVDLNHSILISFTWDREHELFQFGDEQASPPSRSGRKATDFCILIGTQVAI